MEVARQLATKGWKVGIAGRRTERLAALAESMDCCSLVPRYYADPMNKKLETFKLKEHPTWGLYISYKAGAYLDSASREYIRLVKEYWEKHKPMISV